MILSLTNGKVETITTTDISTAFLNAPIDETTVVLISPPSVTSIGNRKTRHGNGRFERQFMV
eukprot:12905168-Prorocentrum_lima.AAC.1